jgi:hypothetical protein
METLQQGELVQPGRGSPEFADSQDGEADRKNYSMLRLGRQFVIFYIIFTCLAYPDNMRNLYLECNTGTSANK